MKEADVPEMMRVSSAMWWAALENLASQWPEVLEALLSRGPAQLRSHLDQVAERARIVRWQAELRYPGLNPAWLDEMARPIFAPDNLEFGGSPPLKPDLAAKLVEFQTSAFLTQPPDLPTTFAQPQRPHPSVAPSATSGNAYLTTEPRGGTYV